MEIERMSKKPFQPISEKEFENNLINEFAKKNSNASNKKYEEVIWINSNA